MIEATFTCGLQTNQVITVNALDEFGGLIDNPTITGAGGTFSVWGAFIWGVGVWATATPKVVQRPIYWHLPI